MDDIMDKLVTTIIVSFFLILIGFVGTQFFSWSFIDYSQGQRTGILTKISKKGVICKTWEGDILVGNGNNVQPEIFKFTVKDDNIAKQIGDKSGQTATIEYTEYGLKSACFGDTSYVITSIK